MNLYLSNPDRLILTFCDAEQNYEKRVFFILYKAIREDSDLRLRHYNDAVGRPSVQPLRCQPTVVTSISATHRRNEWPYR